MALSVYTPTGIVHETSVDFTKRVLTEPVHLVQYDESLPVVAVTCLDAGQYMTLTALDTVSIRMDKGDGTFIYNPALGMSADGHIVYIQITLQMTANYGRFEPVLELLRDGGYGASSPIPMFIDANPVPNEAIQSTSQWESLNDIVARANAIVAGDAVEFTEAEERENIESGENLITMLGKIKKWFTDLGAAAWKAVANNLTTAAAGQAVLDAYQGKILRDMFESGTTITTANCTSMDQNVTVNIACRRYGMLVYYSGSFKTTSDITSYTNIFRFPEGYWPIVSHSTFTSRGIWIFTSYTGQTASQFQTIPANVDQYVSGCFICH